MARILIGCNDMPGVVLHDFFEDCSDIIKQKCVETGHRYTSLTPPNFINDRINSLIPNHDICYVAAHGDPDGVVNENEDYVVSVYTTNYEFKGKVLYTISCLTGQNLRESLLRIGLRLFVGYDSQLKIGESEQDFIVCANAGMMKILEGDTFMQAREHMIKEYDAAINKASFFDKLYLLHNREHLIFSGDLNGSI